MKGILAMALAVLGSCALPAPRPRLLPTRLISPPMESEPATTDGDVTTATVDAVRIIVRRLPGADLVAASLFILGGARNWGADDAGVERLALATAAGGGPEGMSREAYTRRLDELGGKITTESSEDFAELRFKSLAAGWLGTFRLLANVFTHPQLSDAEIELRRAQQISELKEEANDPERQIQLQARAQLFRGHPYQNRAIGTLDTVPRLRRNQLASHLTTLREGHRLLLVLAGDVAASDVIAEVRNRLGWLPVGSYRDSPPPPLPPRPGNLVRVPTPARTASFNAVFRGPTWREPSFPAAAAAIQILSSRVYEEVRVRRSLSYAPGVLLDADTYLPVGALHATTSDPDTTMKVMLAEVTRLQDQPPSAQELDENRAVFLTQYVLAAESTGGVVGALARAQVYEGDWRLSRSWPDRMGRVTPAQVQAFARNYLANLQIVISEKSSRSQ
jgi:zinc protease